MCSYLFLASRMVVLSRAPALLPLVVTVAFEAVLVSVTVMVTLAGDLTEQRKNGHQTDGGLRLAL